jgi:hypothetical protein
MGPGLRPARQESRTLSMETVPEKGLTLAQKQMFFQLFLVLGVGWTVSSLLRQPMLMISFILIGWTLSIITLARAPIGYWNIVRSVVVGMGVPMYLIHRFILPWALARN